jgi:hypothetical protein
MECLSRIFSFGDEKVTGYKAKIEDERESSPPAMSMAKMTCEKRLILYTRDF